MKPVAEDAIKKVKAHASLVIAESLKGHPGKKLHEIPFREIVLTANKVLAKNGLWRRSKTGGRIRPLDKKGKESYSTYELGHTIILARVLSQLKAERRINSREATMLEKSLGKLRFNYPKRVYEKMISAVENMEKKLGKSQADSILERTKSIWLTHDYNKPFVHPNNEEHLFEDSFKNPVSSVLVMTAAKKRNPQETSLAERYKKYLRKMADGVTQETYYS